MLQSIIHRELNTALQTWDTAPPPAPATPPGGAGGTLYSAPPAFQSKPGAVASAQNVGGLASHGGHLGGLGNHGGNAQSMGLGHAGSANVGGMGSHGGNAQNMGGLSYAEGPGYAGYSGASSSYAGGASGGNYVGGNYAGNYPSGTMTYTTGTYAGVNVMYTASGPVGYSGNVAIMYSTSPPQGVPPQGGLVSPGGSMRDRRLPLLLSKQAPDGREAEEPTYVTVKAKKWKVLSVFRKVQDEFWSLFVCGLSATRV